MKEQTMKAIVITDEEVGVKEIENSLKSLQSIVNGYIECVDFQGYTLICNEEGKIMGLPATLDIGYDIICGNVIICKTNEEGEFESLTEDDITDIMWALA